jgi:hypothetical protein
VKIVRKRCGCGDKRRKGKRGEGEEETDHIITYRKIFLDVEKPITDANRSKGDD